jgi:hypothetical protein
MKVGIYNHAIQEADETNLQFEYHAACLDAGVKAPFKTYSKTDPVDLPPVKAQVLRGGKLVDAPVR